ncbi:ADP-ribosylglycohydrolase family protein [Streptosporangium sp. NPDC051022]|uniref:ADP-ribosylglycohydrolase family protein n=1 Tax=Streptosporangium sp. NPDC051022 TaxID=3155752 RepID=UPI003437BFD3
MIVRRSVTDLPKYRSRLRGCLLGGGLGDALGAPVEFDSMQAIRRQYGFTGVTGLVPDLRGRTGLVTDDTQMTLFTVEGLIRAATAEGGFPKNGANAVRHAYLRWLDTQQHSCPPPPDDVFRNGRLREQGWLYSRRAPGNACLSGLRQGQAFAAAPFGEPGPVNSGSKGCGTVMRSAPFGFHAPDARQAFDLAAECAQITHGHPTGYLAAGAFAALVHVVMEGGSLTRAVREAMDLLATYPSHEETTEALRAAVSLAERGDPTPEKVESLGGAWIAEEALAISVYCALSHPEPGDLGRALLLAVNHSGDSDSTGAVCGNLLGALHGEAALPTGWLAHLEGRAAITELADDFAAHTAENHTITEAWLARYPRG